MVTVGLFEAKQKLSELVERASKGEEIKITRHGKLMARLVPAELDQRAAWRRSFEHLDEYRKKMKPGQRAVSDAEIVAMIHEGHTR